MSQQVVPLRPRWVPFVTYFLYACAGLSFLILPSEGLKDLLGPAGFVVWNFLLSFGGVTALIGIAMKSPPIEQIGLPGVVVGLFVYSCYLFHEAASLDTRTGVYIGFGCILLAGALGLVGRMYEVRALRRISARVRKRIKAEGDL